MAPSRRTKIIATNLDHSQRFNLEIEEAVKRILLFNPTLSPQDAILQAQKEMLKNNPFVPPEDGRCLINAMLPIELLTHIFRVGVEMDKEGEDEEFEEVTEGDEKKDLEEELYRVTSDEEGEGEDDQKRQTEDVVMDVVEDAGDDSEWEDEQDPEASESDGEGDMDTDEYSDSEEGDREPHIPFEILVSHVCRHWRMAATHTPDLWSWIEFVAPPRWEMYETYLARAKGHPLTLEIDGSRDQHKYRPEDHPDHPDFSPGPEPKPTPEKPLPFFSSKEIQRIFDMLVPLASQWHQVDIIMSSHQDMKYALDRLHKIPAAPTLETIHMHDEEICDAYTEEFTPDEFKSLTLPFHGNAPNLCSVDLWGVHIDWDAAIPLFSNLKHLNLAYHIERPSFRTFATYLRNSTRLELIELDSSGPQPKYSPLVLSGRSPPAESDREKVEEEDPFVWHAYPVEVPTLQELSLSGHEPEYALALAKTFFFPNIKGMSLCYPNGDFTETILAYTNPSRSASSRRSMFQLIQSLQLLELGYVEPRALNGMLEALMGLKNLCLGDVEEDEDDTVIGKVWGTIFENSLAVQKEVKDKPISRDGEGKVHHPKLLLPHLSAIQTRGVTGADMRRFVEARKSLEVPLKTIMMHSESYVSRKEERWLRANVDEFDYYSDSESEDEDDEISFSVEGLGSDFDEDDAEVWVDEPEDDTADEWTDDD